MNSGFLQLNDPIMLTSEVENPEHNCAEIPLNCEMT